MAVRDDFQVGEVLKSEDLNDTFASKADSTDLTGSNLIYNGAMQVAQRGTSTTSITANGYYTADRWRANIATLGTWTQTIETDAPTGSGFRRSIKMLCTTADASPAAGDVLQIQQLIEGQDVQRIAKGTSSAQQLSLSFWVKSNVTGTYIAELEDIDNSRFVGASYSVVASATWEKKTILFPSDLTGAFDNNVGASLSLNFWLGAGSTFTGGSPLQTAWGTVANTRATGQTNLAASTNNYWQVTGVQLEVGPVATPFEFKTFGQELRECQRYYSRAGGGFSGEAINATTVELNHQYPVPMRAAPTGALLAGDWRLRHVTTDITAASPSLQNATFTTTDVWTQIDGFSGLTTGRFAGSRAAYVNPWIEFRAEL
jgi:hypothetical protein